MRNYLLGVTFITCFNPLYFYYKISNIDKVTLSEIKKHKILTTKCLALSLALLFQVFFWCFNNVPMTEAFRISYLTGSMALLNNINSATASYDVSQLAGAVFTSVFQALNGHQPEYLWTTIVNNAGARRDLGSPYTDRSNNNNNNNNNNNYNRNNNRRRYRRPNFNSNYRNNHRNHNNNYQSNNRNNRRRACARLSDGFCITHQAFCNPPRDNSNNNPQS